MLLQSLSEHHRKAYPADTVALSMRDVCRARSSEPLPLPEVVAVALVQWAVTAFSYGEWTDEDLITAIFNADSGSGASLLPQGFDKARVARRVAFGRKNRKLPKSMPRRLQHLPYHAGTEVDVVGFRWKDKARQEVDHEGAELMQNLRYAATQPPPTPSPPNTPHPTRLCPRPTPPPPPSPPPMPPPPTLTPSPQPQPPPISHIHRWPCTAVTPPTHIWQEACGKVLVGGGGGEKG